MDMPSDPPERAMARAWRLSLRKKYSARIAGTLQVHIIKCISILQEEEARLANAVVCREDAQRKVKELDGDILREDGKGKVRHVAICDCPVANPEIYASHYTENARTNGHVSRPIVNHPVARIC